MPQRCFHIWKYLIYCRGILLVGLASLLAFPALSHAFETKNVRLKLKAVVGTESIGGDAYLEFQLRNMTEQSVYIWESALPWSIGSEGARFVAIPRRLSRVELQQSFGFESGLGFSRIEAGQTLKAKILLKERIPNLEVARENGAVKLQWRYNLTSYASPSLSAKKTSRIFGGLVIVHKRAEAAARIGSGLNTVRLDAILAL